MKKYLFLIVLACCLLFCATALADREISVSSLDGVSGTITVPDDVTVILEKGGPDGITVAASGNTKTFTLNNYEISAGAGGFPAAGNSAQKVVVVELSPETISTGKGTPLTCLYPKTHLGTLQTTGSGALALTAFQFSGDAAAETAMTQDEWNEFETYISDMDMEFTSTAIPTNDKKHNIDIDLKGTNGEVTVYGNSEITVKGKKKRAGLSYKFTITIEYGLVIDNMAVKDVDTGDLKLMADIPLCELGFELKGKGSMGASFSQYFDINISFYIGLHALDFHIDGDHDSGKTNIFGEGEVEVFAGAEIGPSLDLFEILEVGINYKLGITFIYRGYLGHYFTDDDPKYKYHACSDCRYAGIFPQVGPLQVEVAIVKIFSRAIPLIPEKKLDPLLDYHWSQTFPEEEGEGPCPLIAYKVDVHVQDQNRKAIKGAEVTYTPSDETHFKEVITVKTDPFGDARIYVPLKDFKDPNNVTVTASVQDPLNPKDKITASAEITEKGMEDEDDPPDPPDPEDLTLTLDMTTQAIYFEDSGSGTVTGMPQTIYYHASKGKANIPDDIPDKPGLTFTGWNTAKDGSGTAVAPGSQFGSNNDATLYAQWELVSKNYVIQYNANGGSWAPDGQVVPLNQSAMLTDKPAVWAHHNFLGWAETDDAFEPEYPYGQQNEYVPRGEKYIVTLYAVWSFDPVIPPIRVHFDMNGGPQEQAPSDQWIENPSWMIIPTKNIHWDEIHYLAGWSKDPNAKEATYFSGRGYYFTEDTTFYAVWNQFALCELSFKDPAGNDTANMPESVLFVPEVSTKVAVPDTIPWKSGRHFTGWNTEPDGTGKTVAPGSVLNLTKSTVLYAQWEVIGSNWMVLFNANGGDSAPRPQFAKNGEAMILTTAQAAWSHHKFLGWSRSDTADLPDYPVGQVNVIPYNPDETALTLYAVWGFNPVDEPIRISFDMNGGPASQKPADQWLPAGSWIRLARNVPTWDGQHTFLGWSTSKRSRTAEYKAGSMVSFKEDTVLYAVWKTDYRIIQGDGSCWRGGDRGTLRFVANGSINYFRALQIDGRTVPADQYKLTSGSTIVDLPAKYMNTLKRGRHTIRFVYSDGSASGTFSVGKIPVTGDGAHPVLWGLMVLCGAGLGAGLLFRKRKHN